MDHIAIHQPQAPLTQLVIVGERIVLDAEAQAQVEDILNRNSGAWDIRCGDKTCADVFSDQGQYYWYLK